MCFGTPGGGSEMETLARMEAFFSFAFYSFSFPRTA